MDVAINGDIFDLFIKSAYSIKNNLWLSHSIWNKEMSILGTGMESVIKTEFGMIPIT